MERQNKDSGVYWIGKIPNDWTTSKFKHLFRIKKILAGKLGYDVLSVTQQGLKVKNITSNEGQVANDYTNYQLVYPNDFVMNHMDLLTGYVDVSKQEGVTSPDYRSFYAINAKDIVNQYYLYIFQLCYKTRLFYNLGQGVSNLGRWRLPAEQQKEFILPYPPLEDQQRIAKYLDKKCGDIDRLIDLQEQIVEKLKVYKKSVITETVTKGIDPKAKLIPSGIDWIGDIPDSWEICKLNYIYRFQTGATPPSKVEQYFDGDIKWANIADLKSQYVYDTNKHLSETGVAKCNMNISPKGSLMYSFKLSVGAVAFCGCDMYTNEAIATFLQGYGNLHYLYYMAQVAIINNANYNIYGAPILNQDLIQNALIINPPLSEQQKIASYLDEKCSEIDNLIAVKQQKIEKLKDYKKSVIYEAVTGKTIIE